MRLNKGDGYDKIHQLELMAIVCYSATIGGVSGGFLVSKLSVLSGDYIGIALFSTSLSLIAIIPWLMISPSIQNRIDEFKGRNTFEAEIK